MRKILCLFALACLLAPASGLLAASPTRALKLVEDGKSAYSIVIGEKAIPSERFAAEELASHLEQMSGAKLPIVSDADALPAHAILLGNNRYVDDLPGVVVDWKKLGKEGCLLRTVGDHLIIAGGRPRGTLYGVYTLLEDYLGCRWFTPDTSLIPKTKTISLPLINKTDQPAFEYRELVVWSGDGHSPWWAKNFDLDYISRTRANGRWVDISYRHKAIKESDSRIDDRHGGHFRIPHAQHNSSQLVPAKDYAVSHPEYFALKKGGTRTTEGHIELCLTHPDVARITAETMRGWMRAEPEADMFFIGQSDSPNACRCNRCMTAMKTYEPGISPKDPSFGGRGGRAGLNLQFVSRVAELVEDEFPNMRIGTYAYQPTRRPPGNIKAHRNVVIWYCPIEGCACHPIDQGPINKDFYDFEGGIQRWQQIAPGRMYLYAYDFAYSGQSPSVFPIAPTVRAAYRLGMRGAFVDSLMDMQSGFNLLRYWLWTESLRKPNWNWRKGLSEFCTAYYGAGAPYVESYLRLAGNPASYEPLPEDKANIWTSPKSSNRQELVDGCHIGMRRLTDKSIEKGYVFFQQAIKATEKDPKARRHVQEARMELQYVLLDHLPAADPRLKVEAVRLLRMVKKMGMSIVRQKPLSEYRDQLTKRIGATIPE